MHDDYHHPREYLEYAPSPRLVHAGPAYGEYSGRRTAFREHERIYGLPPDEVVYAQPREGSHGREYATFPRQTRYYEDDEPRAEVRYAREPHQRDSATARGRSAADRFLEGFVPDEAGPSEAAPAPPAQGPGTIPSAQDGEAPEPARFVSPPPPPNVAVVKEPEDPPRHPTGPHPRAPSTVSNGSAYQDYLNGRHIPTPDSTGPPRRAGPQRRRDRPHEQRMPSRYYRYMGPPRDEAYGRGPSMSRSQSRRYEEQRRRIDQQETPQPNAEPEYEPVYSREHSVDQASPDDRYYARHAPREYVSVQDRLHPYSPPRYHRYDEHRHPPPVYYDEYGYPITRMRGEPRHHPRNSYLVPYQQSSRYEPERYEYVPVQYERPPAQRYNSRGEYVVYEDRERALPRRPAPAAEVEPEPYEPPPGPDIKVETAPVPMPPEGP